MIMDRLHTMDHRRFESFVEIYFKTLGCRFYRAPNPTDDSGVDGMIIMGEETGGSGVESNNSGNNHGSSSGNSSDSGSVTVMTIDSRQGNNQNGSHNRGIKQFRRIAVQAKQNKKSKVQVRDVRNFVGSIITEITAPKASSSPVEAGQTNEPISTRNSSSNNNKNGKTDAAATGHPSKREPKI